MCSIAASQFPGPKLGFHSVWSFCTCFSSLCVNVWAWCPVIDWFPIQEAFTPYFQCSQEKLWAHYDTDQDKAITEGKKYWTEEKISMSCTGFIHTLQTTWMKCLVCAFVYYLALTCPISWSEWLHITSENDLLSVWYI